MSYTFTLERGDLNYSELEPNYRRHYSEMQERLTQDGIACPDYNPQLERYFDYFQSGVLRNYVVRFEGKPVGHANVYVTDNMHNGTPIAQEDVLYVVPEHRNGVGRKLVKFILEDLKKLGIRQVHISPVTDLRVGKIWKRMGFRPVAELMVYDFEE